MSQWQGCRRAGRVDGATRGGERDARVYAASGPALRPPRARGSRQPPPAGCPMSSPLATKMLLYRSTRLLCATFQHLHQQQQQADVFCDVVLRAEGKAVVAHCCILSVSSPFFMEQLGRELPLQGRRVVLELGGLKIRTLRKLVHFLYTGELKAAQEEVQDVLAAARRLRVTELESLQLQGGRLVRLRPQQRFQRSCLCPPQYGPSTAVSSRAECSTANGTPGSTGVPQQGQPCSLTTTCSNPGPVERVKLRKVDTKGCWEVVQETQPHTVPGIVAGDDGGVPDPQPPLHVGALEQAGRHSAPWQLPQAAWRKQGQAPHTPQQGFRQVVLLGGNLDDPEEEEEVDVGMVEPCLPPGSICVWPCPSSESDEEVDVLT